MINTRNVQRSKGFIVYQFSSYLKDPCLPGSVTSVYTHTHSNRNILLHYTVKNVHNAVNTVIQSKYC